MRDKNTRKDIKLKQGVSGVLEHLDYDSVDHKV